jgi:hypothetical protein
MSTENLTTIQHTDIPFKIWCTHLMKLFWGASLFSPMKYWS